MDKRVIKYVFKDIKFNLLVYFLSLILFLMIMYSLKYFNLIERISGVEIIGALMILIPNSVKILFDFLFLKGNNFKRRTIGIVYLFYGIIKYKWFNCKFNRLHLKWNYDNRKLYRFKYNIF